MKKIKTNLEESIFIMHGNMRKVIERGYQLDHIEMDSEALLDSSKQFMKQIVPWYKRIRVCVFWFPSWWCWVSKPIQASQEQLFDREVTTIE